MDDLNFDQFPWDICLLITINSIFKKEGVFLQILYIHINFCKTT